MNLKLRTVADRAEADELLSLVEKGARATGVAHLERPVAEGVGAHYLDHHFAASESVLVVGESADGPLAIAATAPLIDPLTGDAVPLIVILWVDPSIRHRGVARALVFEVKRRLKERGHDVVTARAAHNDDALISMGERWGLVRSWELMSSE